MKRGFSFNLCFVLGLFLIAPRTPVCGQEESEVIEQLRLVEGMVNETCPRQLNEHMVLRQVMASSTTPQFTFVRQYTDAAIGDFDRQAYLIEERQDLENYLRTTGDIQQGFGKMNVTVVYADYSKDMELIARFVFQPSDYVLQAIDDGFSALDMSLSDSKYNCDGAGKAKGLRFSVRPPNSWEAMDGERPNVLRKWEMKMPSGLRASVMILISEKDELLVNATRAEINDVVSDAAFVQGLAEQTVLAMSNDGYPSILLDASAGKVDGEPTVIMDYVVEFDRLGVKILSHTRQYRVFTQGQSMDVQFYFPSESALEAHQTMMFLMMNSVVFPDKWQR